MYVTSEILAVDGLIDPEWRVETGEGCDLRGGKWKGYFSFSLFALIISLRCDCSDRACKVKPEDAVLDVLQTKHNVFQGVSTRNFL